MATVALAKELIRSSEELKAVIEVTQGSLSPNGSLQTTSESSRNKYVLLVVVHKDDWDLTEEGCLFVCKNRWSNGAQNHQSTGGRHPAELDIVRVFPIYGQFSVAISQVNKEGSDSRGSMINSAAPRAVRDHPHSVILLSITPAEGATGNDTTPLNFIANNVESLKGFVAECKRLKETSELDAGQVVNLAQSTIHFSWLRPYFSKKTTIKALTTVPQDLRHINQPLLDRLTPCCAGQTGDDRADIQVMRDDWIRVQAKEMSRRGKRTLSIRLGTFNVNGQMPTQDLSSWVRRSLESTKQQSPLPISTPSLPPVAKISPFSMTRNPFDWIVRRPSLDTKDQLDSKPERSSSRVDEENPDDPDLLVFGFQELDLSTEALLYTTSTVREDAWCHAIFASLGEKAARYEKLASKQLVGMLIVIVVKKSLRSCFGDVKTAMAGAGILGVLGNKGGAAIRMLFTPPNTASATLQNEKSSGGSGVEHPGSTTLTFVNAHLAAFDEMVDKRNSDFHDLSRRLTFENSAFATPSEADRDGDAPKVGELDDADQTAGLNPPLSVYECDLVFWMGDLNYRVDVPDIEMRRTLRNEEWELRHKFDALLHFDQLKQAIGAKKAFFGFQECEISHMPTYRFSPGLAMDKLGYDLKRKPAWTDRILFMHGPGCEIVPLAYNGHPRISMSDHRPVSGDFEVDVDLYDVHEHRSKIVKLFNEVSYLDSESDKGGLKIHDTFIDFGKLHYGKEVERKLEVYNTAKLPRAFRFVPVQLDSPIHPEWLQIHPMTGILLANESTEITLRAEVNVSNATKLNARPQELDGTLILHTMVGKDHFISLTAEYQRTCFANRLSWLTRLRGPIRSMNQAADLLPESHSRNAPKEIIRLVNWMMTNNAASDDIFIISGEEELVDVIRECLDTGDDFPFLPQGSDSRTRLAFATTLLQLLESLPEPVIPSTLHRRCMEMSNRDEAFEVLDEVQPAAVNVWISITAFLHFVSQSLEKTRIQQIASVLAPVLLRDDDESTTLPIPPREKCKFLMYFMG